MAVLALDESSSSVIGPITLGEKCAGKRSAGNPHAAFEAAGTGNGATARPIRARRGRPRIQTRMILTGHRASPRPYQGAGQVLGVERLDGGDSSYWSYADDDHVFVVRGFLEKVE